MSEANKIVIKITTARGHDIMEFAQVDAGKAVEALQGFNGKKWVFVNGDLVNPDNINEGMLRDAEDVTVANAVVGG